MYVPLVSPWLESDPNTSLERRKGGGRGGGGRSGGSKGGSRGGSSGLSSGGSIKLSSGSTVSTKASGVTKVSTIPAGQPFAGRSIGGGTRSNIYGTGQYGSGYPGTQAADVINRGFPFGFWPITFGAGAGLATSHRFHTNEYGEPNNSSRPGGVLVVAPFQPRIGANTYRVLSDNTTVTSLISSIKTTCFLNTTLISPVPFTGNDDPTQPKPEQVIQYYRASSIALTLDGYNNSAVFSDNTSTPNTPLPTILDTTFLNCMNQTIGTYAPLMDSGATLKAQFSGLLGLAWVTFYLLCIGF